MRYHPRPNMKTSTQPRKQQAKGPLTARTADRYDLYQRSVQAPEHDLAFIDRLAMRHSGRPALRLREDFCGTALLAAAWSRSRPDREAWAIDIDPEPLAWGREHNIAPLGPAASRVHLVQADVLSRRTPPCDVVVAPNFSFCCFKERSTLLRYFTLARRVLRPGGFLVADLFGGPTCMETVIETRRVGSFTYVWEQSSFDPITGHLVAHIGFRFRDGSSLKRAFTYDWRLWSLPELRDLLHEAGFRETEVYWELTGKDGNGTGTFRRMERTTPCESFVCSLIGVR